MNKTNNALIQAYQKGYRVLNGKVFYNDKIVNGRIRKDGYHTFSIRMDSGERYPILTHRLVAFQKFGEKIFERGIQVRHLDSNSTNNNDNNIEIGSAYDNSMDKEKGLLFSCARYAASFLIKYNVYEIKKRRNEGASYSDIMKEFDIPSKGTVSYIINKR